MVELIDEIGRKLTFRENDLIIKTGIIIDVLVGVDGRRYRVKWLDGYPNSSVAVNSPRIVSID